MNYIGDLDLNEDITKDGGDYQRTDDIATAIRILLGTDIDYWGNILDRNLIPGGLELLDGTAINNSFLTNYEAKMQSCLEPLKTKGYASKIEVSAENPRQDFIEYTVTITRTDNSIYEFTNKEIEL